MSELTPDWVLSAPAAPRTLRAWADIAKVVRDRKLSSGGISKCFYTPEEWWARGEPYGRGAVLVIVHDGGALSRYGGGAAEEAWEEIERALDAHELYTEQLTGWSTGVYDARK